MPVLAYNKRANYDYEIAGKYEAGLVLFGHEVKSIKTGHISLKGAFVTLKKNIGKPLPELYLTNAHIPKYKMAGIIKNHAPDRPRKLLLHKQQITHLIGKKQEQGLTLVPIKIYTKRGLIKLEFGIGRGKKKIDKREIIKKREVDRKIRTLTKYK
ncbi:MAG: SsrA-binding protein SmpB [Patescibacteria group bacterium]|nr:SsrA-binding protein SmpB [Patescibacteria group bacterium]